MGLEFYGGNCVVRQLAILGTVLFTLCTSSIAVAGEPNAPQRGDVDADGARSITDAIFLLGFLFLGGDDPSCPPSADADNSGDTNITDAIFILSFLFLGGPEPDPLTPKEDERCSGGDDAKLIERGREVYHSSDPKGNLYSCGTCHSAEPEIEGGIRHAANSLHDAVRRPSYKLGLIDTLVGAANVCREDWMRTSAWKESDDDFVALTAYLTSLAPDEPAPTARVPDRRADDRRTAPRRRRDGLRVVSPNLRRLPRRQRCGNGARPGSLRIPARCEVHSDEGPAQRAERLDIRRPSRWSDALLVEGTTQRRGDRAHRSVPRVGAGRGLHGRRRVTKPAPPNPAVTDSDSLAPAQRR